MMISNLVETHCHILPGIDDGAKDLETSIKMVEQLQKQGAQKIIATPHYYSDTLSLADFLKKREAAYNTLTAALPDGAPEIILGAEVFVTRFLFMNEDLKPLSFGAENYMLTEHPFSCPFEDEHMDRVLSLCCDYNLTPILAHIERYPALMSNPDKLDRLLHMGCIAQANVEAFNELSLFQRKKLFKYLESGRIQLIGSDCHNLSSRAPDYSKGAERIIKKCGNSKINELMQNANNLF